MQCILAAVAVGFFHTVVAGPPCSTWSKARFNLLFGGPRPLRTRSQPWGRTDINMSTAETRQLNIATKLLINTLRIMTGIAKAGGTYILEHPRDPGGPPYPSIWDLPEVAAL